MQELTGALTMARCRAAAESIVGAEDGARAIGTLRPRGLFGVLRRRGPLALMLYVAARDQLLVWRNPESLALLQAPGEKGSPLPGRGLRLAVLRVVVRSWESVVFIVPAVTLLAGAAVAAAGFALTGAVGLGLTGIFLAIGAMLHIAVLMVCFVITAVVRTVRTLTRPTPPRDRIAAELLPGRQWTVVLSHHVDRAAPHTLLRRIDQQLGDLLRGDLEIIAREKGLGIPAVQVTETMVFLLPGVTTRPMRDAVTAWTRRGQIFHDGAEVALRLSDHRPAHAPDRIFDSGGFLLWYAGGSAAVLAMLAHLVAGWERDACTGPCAGRPVTYLAAARWLLQRLLLSDPLDLGPATRQAWTVGWLTSLLSITGLFVAVAAVRQYIRARNARMTAIAREVERMHRQTETLVVVATDVEHRAVRAAVRAVTDDEPRDDFLPHQVVTRLGTIGRTRISLVQVEPGAVGPGSAAIAAAALISRLRPDFLILTGICYGLRPDREELGDVLVCAQLRAMDLRKMAEPAGHRPAGPITSGAEAQRRIEEVPPPAGEPTVIDRGDHVTPSPMLLGRFRAAARALEDTMTVHFGQMLSASTLVSSRAVRDRLRAEQPEALGGEMEGAGIYAAAAHAKVDWIVVKGICDWAFDKSDDFHEKAAANAAALVVRVAESGGLDDAPAHGDI